MHLEIPETVRYALEIAARDRERLRRMAEWMDRWRGHCSNCLGAGYEIDFGPPGDGEQPSPSMQPCSCLREGHCPRCAGTFSGFAGGDEDEEGDDCGDFGVVCPHCGWCSDYPDVRPFGIDPDTAEADDDILRAGLFTASIVIRGFNDRGDTAGPIAAIRGPSVRAAPLAPVGERAEDDVDPEGG